MENAEVLEMTVKKVEDILKNRSQGNTSSWDNMVDMIHITNVLCQWHERS